MKLIAIIKGVKGKNTVCHIHSYEPFKYIYIGLQLLEFPQNGVK